MSPVQLASTIERSRHGCAAATGLSLLLRLRPWPHRARHASGPAVSCWHSLPQGTGTFPAALLGAGSPCVRCEAVLPLPPSTSRKDESQESSKKSADQMIEF